VEKRYRFYADFLNGWEEDGEPQPKPEPQREKSIVIGKRVKEKDLWHKLRHFLWRV
tara:strand:- start:311 stop:478 length:168 start_codon:yes stop_codon:yes gene_type:complete